MPIDDDEMRARVREAAGAVDDTLEALLRDDSLLYIHAAMLAQLERMESEIRRCFGARKAEAFLLAAATLSASVEGGSAPAVDAWLAEHFPRTGGSD